MRILRIVSVAFVIGGIAIFLLGLLISVISEPDVPNAFGGLFGLWELVLMISGFLLAGSGIATFLLTSPTPSKA